MAMNVADALWTMLADAGVRHCYGIGGDSLNPTLDALRRNGSIEFVGVHNPEAAGLAAVAEAGLSGAPVAVCGTSGPGTTQLCNGLLEARREAAPVIAVIGDADTAVLDTETMQDVNPYLVFSAASRYTARIVNPHQTRAVVQTAIGTAVGERAPVVIGLPGDIAIACVPDRPYRAVAHHPPIVRPSDVDLRTLAEMIDAASAITILGGDGCRDAHDEVVALAQRLEAPVAYAYRGKQWLEWDNPNAVGMTGVLGWGGATQALRDCDLCLLLGTGFPYRDFYPEQARKVQIDHRAASLGRRTELDLGLVGDVGDTVAALLPLVARKTDNRHLEAALAATARWRERAARYGDHGGQINPIRPEFLVGVIDEMAGPDAIFTVDTGTPCIWAARGLTASRTRSVIGSFNWASMGGAMPYAIGAAKAAPHRPVIALCGDGGLTMLLGDLLTIAGSKLPVKLVVFNNAKLDFTHIEMEGAGLLPFGTELHNPDFARMAETFGITGVRVEGAGGLRAAVGEVLDVPGPALLDVVVDPNALKMPERTESDGWFNLSQARQTIHGSLDDVIGANAGGSAR